MTLEIVNKCSLCTGHLPKIDSERFKEKIIKRTRNHFYNVSADRHMMLIETAGLVVNILYLQSHEKAIVQSI